LPLLSEEDVEHLFNFFKESTTPVVRAKKEITPVVKGKNNNNRRYTNREITAFLSCFGEEFTNGTHDDWIPIVMAVHHETRGSNEGKELARRWSKQGSTYDEENFNYKWSTFVLPEEMSEDEQKKKCSTFASLFKNHRKLIPDGLLCDRFSDAYNKALFAICNHGNFFYVESLGGWFVRKKHLWELCNGSNELMLSRVHRFLIGCRESGKDLEDWSEEKKIQARQIAKATGMPLKKSPRDQFYASFKVEKVEGTAKAKSSLNLLEASGLFRIEANKVDSNTRYIADIDGILDLETGQQITPKEELYITKSTGTSFVTGKPSQEFMDLVSSYFESEEVMYFFLRCVGMALLGGNKAQRFIHIRGVGGSGKSTLMNLIKFAFGNQYVMNAEASDIMQNRPPEAGKANPSIIRLMGSRIVIISETNENDELNAARIKQMTGGDGITARLNYGNIYKEETASFTPFIVSNKPLFVRNPDDAWWRRYIVIPFDKPIANRDATFAQKLETEYALEAKKWFMEGIKAYIRIGLDVNIPEVCKKAKEEDLYGLNPYQQWIDDCCEVGNDCCEEKSILARSYSEYCERELNLGRKTISTRTVTINLRQRGFYDDVRRLKNNGEWKTKRVILGLKLKPAFEDIEDDTNNVIDFKRE
ncbi:DNA primase, partial [Candidatus Liberibacter solanacearum]